MTHSFSNCPLRSCCLLITNHTTQSIVTATDEILDLLGYSLKELSGQSIHSPQLDLRLSCNLTTLIPECSIKHAQGNILEFQVCIHQDPLGGGSCLDYWLIKRIAYPMTCNNHPYLHPLSILKLSQYGTIEQAQLSTSFHQSRRELLGKPIMAYVYKDDVYSLCSNLSKLYTTTTPSNVDPLFIRWSKLPCLISTSYLQQEDSLNYDWISFSIVSTTSNQIKPVCIIKPLQVITCEEDQQHLVLRNTSSLFTQLLNYAQDFIQHGKAYIQEFIQYLLLQIIISFVDQNEDSFLSKMLKSTQFYSLKPFIK